MEYAPFKIPTLMESARQLAEDRLAALETTHQLFRFLRLIQKGSMYLLFGALGLLVARTATKLIFGWNLEFSFLTSATFDVWLLFIYVLLRGIRMGTLRRLGRASMQHLRKGGNYYLRVLPLVESHAFCKIEAMALAVKDKMKKLDIACVEIEKIKKDTYESKIFLKEKKDLLKLLKERIGWSLQIRKLLEQLLNLIEQDRKKIVSGLDSAKFKACLMRQSETLDSLLDSDDEHELIQSLECFAEQVETLSSTVDIATRIEPDGNRVASVLDEVRMFLSVRSPS